MSTATATRPATATVNLKAMGIADMDQAIRNGQATVADVYEIVKGRIDQRTKDGRNQLRPVVEYANKLATLMSMAGPVIPSLPVPTYGNKVQPNHALPSDPAVMADVIVATVGISNLGLVIAALTARIVGSSVAAN